MNFKEFASSYFEGIEDIAMRQLAFEKLHQNYVVTGSEENHFLLLKSFTNEENKLFSHYINQLKTTEPTIFQKVSSFHFGGNDSLAINTMVNENYYSNFRIFKDHNHVCTLYEKFNENEKTFFTECVKKHVKNTVYQENKKSIETIEKLNTILYGDDLEEKLLQTSDNGNPYSKALKKDLFAVMIAFSIYVFVGVFLTEINLDEYIKYATSMISVFLASLSLDITKNIICYFKFKKAQKNKDQSDDTKNDPK